MSGSTLSIAMLRRCLGLSLIACLILLPSACDDRDGSSEEELIVVAGNDPGDPPANEAELLAAELREAYNTAPNVRVRCNIRIKPPDEDPVNFNLRIDFDDEGRAFVQAHKWGHHLFDGLIEADWQTTMLLVREDRAVTGKLNELDRPAAEQRDVLGLFAGNLQHILNEFRLGPVPPYPATELRPDIDGPILIIDGDPTVVHCRLDDEGKEVNGKTLFTRSGDDKEIEVLRLRYRRYQTWTSRMKRARDIRVQIPENPTSIRVTIDKVEAFKKRDPLRITIPEGWPVGSLKQFLAEVEAQAQAAKAARESEAAGTSDSADSGQP